MGKDFVYLAGSIDTPALMPEVCNRADDLVVKAYNDYVDAMAAQGYTELSSLYMTPESELESLCTSLNIQYKKLKFYREFNKTFAVYTAKAKDIPLKSLKSNTLFLVYQSEAVYEALLRGRTTSWFKNTSDMLLKTVNDFETYCIQHSEDDDALCLIESAIIARFRRDHNMILDLSEPLPEAYFDKLIRGIATTYMTYIPKIRRKTIDIGWCDLDSGKCWFNDSYYCGTLRVEKDGNTYPLAVKQRNTNSLYLYESLPIFIYGNKVYDFENDYSGVDFMEYMKMIEATNPDFWFDSTLSYGKLWDDDVMQYITKMSKAIVG